MSGSKLRTGRTHPNGVTKPVFADLVASVPLRDYRRQICGGYLAALCVAVEQREPNTPCGGTKMLTFDVRQAGSWYIAECSEIGLGITAKGVAAIEETADRAARARGYKGVLIRQAEQQATFVARVAAFFRTTYSWRCFDLSSSVAITKAEVAILNLWATSNQAARRCRPLERPSGGNRLHDLGACLLKFPHQCRS